MKFNIIYLFLCAVFIQSDGSKPFKPPKGGLPFMAYFNSRYRSMCAATLISRTAALTASACVVDAAYEIKHNGSVRYDRRPINLVIGSDYRHVRRGIKIQVTKLILPRLPVNGLEKGSVISSTMAIMLLESRAPDILMEYPPRGTFVDTTGAINMELFEECVTAGWHYFVKGDVIHVGRKFPLKDGALLAQFVNTVKMRPTCETLELKYEAAMTRLGQSDHNVTALVCSLDPTNVGQACHGTYGSPLLCKNTVVGVMVAPDGQWTNCTGKSNLFHLVSASNLKAFFECTRDLFDPEFTMDLDALREELYKNEKKDIKDTNYDLVLTDSKDESRNWGESQQFLN